MGHGMISMGGRGEWGCSRRQEREAESMNKTVSTNLITKRADSEIDDVFLSPTKQLLCSSPFS